MEDIKYMKTLQETFLDLANIIGELIAAMEIKEESEELNQRLEGLMGRYFMKCLELESLKKV